MGKLINKKIVYTKNIYTINKKKTYITTELENTHFVRVN